MSLFCREIISSLSSEDLLAVNLFSRDSKYSNHWVDCSRVQPIIIMPCDFIHFWFGSSSTASLLFNLRPSLESCVCSLGIANSRCNRVTRRFDTKLVKLRFSLSSRLTDHTKSMHPPFEFTLQGLVNDLSIDAPLLPPRSIVPLTDVGIVCR